MQILVVCDPGAMQQWTDRLPGGYADKGPPPGVSADQVRKGIAVEMEHTNDPRIALEIALDHLCEDPLYYDKLARMEGGACGGCSIGSASSSYLPESHPLVRCLRQLQKQNIRPPVSASQSMRILNDLDRCMKRSGVRGVGVSPSTVSALATVGVLLAILVAMPIMGSLSQRKR